MMVQILEDMRGMYLDVETVVMMIQQKDLASLQAGSTLAWLEAVVASRNEHHTSHHPLTNHSTQENDVRRFFLEEGLDRVNTTVCEKVHHEWTQVIHAAKKLHEAMIDGEQTHGANIQQHSVNIRGILDAASASVERLDAFVRHNVVLGSYVAQYLDGVLHKEGNSREERYFIIIERILMHGVGMSSLLMALSDVYQGVRVLEEHGPCAKQVLNGLVKHEWKAPSTFNRVTKKFWILPRDVLKFKLYVMKHLPILVYGERRKVLDQPADALEHARMRDFSCRDSGDIASVYLDSVPSLSHYHDRLHRRDMAKAVRVRWYGFRDCRDGDKDIFVERKIHRSAYTGTSSTKERGGIKERDVANFLRGQHTVNAGAKDASFLQSVMDEIHAEEQVPLMRTSYQRTAFQNSTENMVRISLDTNLCMTKEYGYATSHSWCRDFSLFPLRDDDVAQFPYGVVEIKLQAKPPQWVKDLVSTGMLLVVPKFSKFLHGSACLYQDYTENVPYWFLPDPENKDHLTPATWEEMADKEDAFAKHAADWLFPQGFEDPSNEEKHLSLAFFSPKKTLGKSPGEKTVVNTQQEAIADLEDYSGNRTWCDVEHVPINSTLVVTKRSWPIYQNASDHEGGSTSSDHTGSHGFSSDSTSVLPYKDYDKIEKGHTVATPIAYGMNGSYGAMQYSMSSKKEQDPKVPVKRSSSLVRTRVEPKTFFANERTFLQWINISVLVMFLALSLLSGSSLAPGSGSSITTSCNTDDSKCLAGKMSGAIIAPVALSFMAYALYMYKKRTIQILRRETVRYDDQRGPVVLVVILLLVMTISYILTMIYVF